MECRSCNCGTALLNRGGFLRSRQLSPSHGMRAGYEEGNFIGPTVLSDVTPRMDVYKQEIFGPVLVQMEANDLEDAIRIINEVRCTLQRVHMT